MEKCSTSRNNVKSLLSGHYVLVNGSPVSRHDFLLAKDDEVRLSKRPVLQKEGGRGEPKGKNGKFRLKILYEDADFIAIDKPAGLLSVESDKETECAFGYVLEYMRAENPAARPYILHRIDKETSGVLVFAKNVKVHSLLRLDWNRYVTLREYYALVEGRMEQKEGTLVSYLRENRNNMVYVTHDPSGQRAVTHYSLVCGNDAFSPAAGAHRYGEEEPDPRADEGGGAFRGRGREIRVCEKPHRKAGAARCGAGIYPSRFGRENLDRLSLPGLFKSVF